jgi:hypothetical protein
VARRGCKKKRGHLSQNSAKLPELKCRGKKSAQAFFGLPSDFADGLSDWASSSYPLVPCPSWLLAKAKAMLRRWRRRQNGPRSLGRVFRLGPCLPLSFIGLLVARSGSDWLASGWLLASGFWPPAAGAGAGKFGIAVFCCLLLFSSPTVRSGSSRVTRSTH